MARIGTVGYLNARPLTDEIAIDRHTVVLAHPAEVARMLRAGEVDVALVPVGAALSDGDYRIVPGSCIGADGPVASVLLVAERPVEEWTKVLLDGVSRTSVLLARLLLARAPALRDRLRPGLVVEDAPPNTALARAKGATAALVIGDQARALPDRLSIRLDLALLWKSWTGLPFVFAVWAGRPDLDPAVVEDLRVAGLRGVARIAEKYAGKDLDYLTSNLRYPLDDAALVGLRRFGAEAHRLGLVPRADVELFGPPARRKVRPDTDRLLGALLDGGALPVGDLAALLEHAPVAELFAAADLVRRGAFPGDQVPYRVEAASPVAEARAAGATRVTVSDAAPDGIRAAAALGFEVAVPWDAVRGAVDLDAAKAAGASVLVDTAGVPGRALRVREAAERGWRVEAGVAVGASGPAALAGWLLQLRDLAKHLAAVRVWAAELGGSFGERPNTATDHLRAVTLARLVVPAPVRVVASPESEGAGMGQVSLRAGCDHAGAVRLDGPPEGWPARIAAHEHQVREAGFRPVREARG